MLRPITTDDVGLIIDHILALHVESAHYNKVTPNEPYVHNTLTSMIEQPSFIGTIDVDLRGFIFGNANRSWYDPTINAYECLLYILPEHRGTMLAPRMIRQFEKYASRLGCVNVIAGASTLVNTETTLRLYERLGYTRVGNTVTKRIQEFV